MTFKDWFWRKWTRFTGASWAEKLAFRITTMTKRDLCQNFNQLESRVTDISRAVRNNTNELKVAISTNSQSTRNKFEERLAVQRETIVDMKGEISRQRGEITALNEEISSMSIRLEQLEAPSPEKISG